MMALTASLLLTGKTQSPHLGFSLIYSTPHPQHSSSVLFSRPAGLKNPLPNAFSSVSSDMFTSCMRFSLQMREGIPNEIVMFRSFLLGRAKKLRLKYQSLAKNLDANIILVEYEVCGFLGNSEI